MRMWRIGGQRVQDAHPLLDRVDLGEQTLEGQRLSLRKVENHLPIAGPGHKAFVQPPGLFRPGYDDQKRRIQVPPERRQREGCGIGQNLDPGRRP